MSSKYGNFAKKTEIDKQKDDIRDARQSVLNQAKHEYERKEYEEEQRKRRGEDKWMLPSVSERIEAENEELEKAMKKKNKKEKKKERKAKKEKKKKKSKSKSDSSDENESEGELWVEKKKKDKDKKKEEEPQTEKSSETSKEPPLKRDDWMTMLPGFLPTVTRDEMRGKTKKSNEPRPEMFEKPGLHKRELNPYWKDGGTGMPSEEQEREHKPGPSSSTAKPSNPAGDGGVTWLKKAYQRCKEQAEEEGRSLEEVASERWGSLENLRSMIDEAEGRHGHHRSSRHDSRQMFAKPGEFRSKAPPRPRPGRDAPSWRKPQSAHSERPPEEKPSTSSAQPSRSTARSRSSSSSSSEERSPSEKEDKSESESSPEDAAEPAVQQAAEAPVVLTEEEMNQLSAKILRYEMMGDEDEAQKLKAKLEAARSALSQQGGSSSAGASKGGKRDPETVLLTKTDQFGRVRPMRGSSKAEPRGKRRKAEKIKSFDDKGERERYFEDDDKYSLKDLIQQERSSTAEEQNLMFANMASKHKLQANSDEQVDDQFVDRASDKRFVDRCESMEQLRAIVDHKKRDEALDKCQCCFDSSNMLKHLIVAIGIKTYLCVPNHESLTEGHCLIVPMQHVACTLLLDEDIWTEIKVFRKGLTAMFADHKLDCIFMETCKNVRGFHHTFIECIPVPQDVGFEAPMYFKKAIMECESEWAQNKKLVDLKDRELDRAVPKGLPYFFVHFGNQNGFAHIIEDNDKFPHYFGREVIGGLVDAEARLWRKPAKENFDVQRAKVMELAEWWKPYDWTQRLKQS